MTARRTCRCLALALFRALFLALAVFRHAPAAAAEYFAAPHGSSRGAGTRFVPWDLATALSGDRPVRPGDTIWLLGGVYPGGIKCRLQGLPGRPITVRQAAGQRAILDCRARPDENPNFTVEGDWTVFWGFEITCSDPRRVTRETGSWPSDMRRGGVDCRASHVEFVNLIVHDLGSGIGFWSEGEGGTIYGCLIYNNGWQAPDRAHGHGVYAQSRQGTKTLADNIIFNQFGYGIHCYGSERAYLENLALEGNILFNNGCLSRPESRAPNILIGGQCPVRGAVVRGNVAYSDQGGTSLRLGYAWGPSNRDAAVHGNTFVGTVEIRDFEELAFAENTLIGQTQLVLLNTGATGDPADYRWDRNRYLLEQQDALPFSLVTATETAALSFADWQRCLAVDRGSVLAPWPPPGVQIVLRPNAYEPGRAHVAILNGRKQEQVELELGSLLEEGQEFRIVSAQNLFAEPLVQGRYEGRPLRIRLADAPAAARPVGLDDLDVPVTEPDFAALVVLPERLSR